jgi:hypothetical protein
VRPEALIAVNMKIMVEESSTLKMEEASCSKILALFTQLYGITT